MQMRSTARGEKSQVAHQMAKGVKGPISMKKHFLKNIVQYMYERSSKGMLIEFALIAICV
jgi:predicted solute-binding protein